MTLDTMTQPCTAAVVQDSPVFLNLEASLEKACGLIGEAAAQGAKVIAFPETWLPGYPVWLDYAPKAAAWDYGPAKALYRLLVGNSISIPGPQVERLLEVAKNAGSHVVMGVHEREGGTLYNTLLILDRDGSTFKVHRKLVPTYGERLVWGRGDGSTLRAHATEFGVLGGLICWEHWMPLTRAAMHAQHESIHVAQWPSVNRNHDLASRHYAFEGRCFVLAAGSVLTKREAMEGCRSLGAAASEAMELLESTPKGDEDLLLRGGSAIIAPNAKNLAGPVLDEACILYAELRPELITEGHFTLDTNGHYARPDVFTLEVNDLPQSSVAFRSQSREE
jgi:predicted amidohydrolase